MRRPFLEYQVGRKANVYIDTCLPATENIVDSWNVEEEDYKNGFKQYSSKHVFVGSTVGEGDLSRTYNTFRDLQAKTLDH